MNKRPIDFERVKRATVRLDAYLANHPDALGERTESEWLDIVKGVLMDKEIFTVKEVAQIFRVDEETIRRAIRKNRLKAAKVGRDFRISRADLEEYYQDEGGGNLWPADGAE
ncbi:MAG: helix-turn-helix domain-containing protein [Deltaproteobacteria bacterium]|jgi:excisionase family DNA binding protein|nr:helix-turn-helix domain-containing protein [Deltaproteobacteria bacterium]